jgi:hypothetical protein
VTGPDDQVLTAAQPLRAARSAVGWVLGCAVCLAPPIGVLLFGHPHNSFRFGLLIVVFILGMLVYIDRLLVPPPIALSTVYPVIVVATFVLEGADDHEIGTFASSSWIAAGLAIACIAAYGSVVSPNPRRWFRVWSLVWTILALLTLPAWGLGVVAIPLALSNRVASHQTGVRRREFTHHR